MNEGRETPQNKTIKEYISTKKESGKWEGLDRNTLKKEQWRYETKYNK
jgi:hypothetical protein